MNGAMDNTVSPTTTDAKIDPSIGQAITTGHEQGPSTGSVAPAYTSNATNGEATSGATTALPEKHAEVPSTTTTTIITTTTGGPANGSAVPETASPTNVASPTSVASPTATGANGATHHTGAAAPAAAAAGGAAAGAAAAEPKHTETVMAPKDAKKYQKLLQKEAKNDEKDLAAAIKDAQNLEKPVRKAQKAEKQSIKRHQSAVSDEHKASKEFNKAKAKMEQAQAALKKALEELDIKKKHTTTTNESYTKAKARIDELRNSKIKKDQDRARRQQSIHTTT